MTNPGDALCGLGMNSQLAQYIGPKLGGSVQVGTVSVQQFGAVGDGVTDDTVAIQTAISAAFGTPASPNGINYTLNKELYFPPGNYKTTAPLVIPNVQGPVIRGAGRFMTSITNNANTNVFTTNGFEYGQVRGMALNCSGSTAICFDLNWDGSTGVALQSNTFSDMFFNGGAQGVRIAAGGFMGSENLFLSCFWINHAVAGLSTNCFNALQNTVVGGNFQGCNVGVQMGSGTVNCLSVGFQTSTNFDITQSASAHDAIFIHGCRSESVNFFTGGGMSVSVIGCNQRNAAAGTFVSQNGPIHISACQSDNGRITASLTPGLTGTVSACTFYRDDWLDLNAANSLVVSNVKSPTKYIANQTFANSANFAGAGTYFNNFVDFSSNLPTTVAGLAALVTAGAGDGARAFVTDATATTFGSIVAGGGTNKVPVFRSSTNWLIG